MKKVMKIFGSSKNSCTFAATKQQSNVCSVKRSGYFYGYKSAVLKNRRLSIHNGLLLNRCNLTVASSWKDSLSYFDYLIFHYMQQSMKNASMVNNSSRASTSTGTKSVEISDVFNPEFINITQQLKHANEWFLSYREKAEADPRTNNHVFTHLLGIEVGIGDAVANIADIVAIEFRENLYYDGKQEGGAS